MRISAICTGDELLDGRVRDLNIYYMGRELAARGASFTEISIVDDTLDAIHGALVRHAPASDLILVTGGLGPTSDDRTREAVARAAGVDLTLDQSALDALYARFALRGVSFTENNRKQATFPRGSEVIANEVGTAAGFSIELDGARVICMPGVPRELEWFIDAHLDSWLHPERSQRDRDHVAIARRSLHCFGLGESALEDLLDGLDAIASAQDVIVAWRAASPLISITLRGQEMEAIDRVCDFIHARAERYIIGEDDEGLFERLGRLLGERGESVTAAESCTAGLIAAAFTDTPGSSAYVQMSFVTYSNASKHALVGVSEAILDTYGAVSAQTVCQMASGARERAEATYGLAVSGIAGPGGGSDFKPVGTVHFAIASPAGVYHRQVLLKGRSRRQVRQASVYIAATLLLWTLEGKISARPVRGPFTRDQVWADGGVPIEPTSQPTPTS